MAETPTAAEMEEARKLLMEQGCGKRDISPSCVIVYTSSDDSFTCAAADEETMLVKSFIRGGREISDYTRSTFPKRRQV